LRDAFEKFEAAGVRLYAISYDDQKVLADFSEKQRIPYPLLSDIDSEVIREYGILNTRIEPGDAFLYGIPFPGAYVADENGVVVAKFFHDTYKKRDSPEILLDAALGQVTLSDDTPRTTAGEEEVRVTAAVHGGRGTIRQGIRRHLVVRFELGNGLHIYGDPVPEGMVPVQISVTGPPGLIVEDPVFPPTTPLHLESVNIELSVWSGTVDFVFPFYPIGELVSETRPLDRETVTVEARVRYQACDDRVCLLPKTETLELEIPLDVIDVPNLPMHGDHGQRVSEHDWRRHLIRLFVRKVGKRPWAFPGFIWKSLKLELAARRRARRQQEGQRT
jgi:hypothetical protein